MRKTIKQAVLAVSTSLLIQAPVQAAEYTLRFAHFFPPVSSQHKEIAQTWADKVKAESDGRIEIEVYPSSTLAKPAAQYDAVKNRIADVTMTVQGYTANRFPLTQIVELPGVVKTATQGSCVLQSAYDEGLLDSEYKETKPLFMFTHGQGHIHTTEKMINSPEDLQGLRIRRPSAVVAKMLEGLGAQPVGMPAPKSYQSVQRGVIDGIVLPWEGMYVFRINELATKHIEVGGLYAIAFVVTINKDVYNSMPADLQQVIDNNSGAEWAKTSGAVFDKLDVKGRAQAVEQGHEIYTLEGGINNPEWKPVLDKATEEYLNELEAKGLPARKVFTRMKELSAACS